MEISLQPGQLQKPVSIYSSLEAAVLRQLFHKMSQYDRDTYKCLAYLINPSTISTHPQPDYFISVLLSEDEQQ
jgi:hypothetical protein